MGGWPWSMALLVFCGASLGTVGMVFLGARRPRRVLASGGMVLGDWLMGLLLGWAFVVLARGGRIEAEGLWALFGLWSFLRLLLLWRVIWRPAFKRQLVQAVSGAKARRAASSFQEIGVVIPPGEEALAGVERIENSSIEGAEEQEGYAQAARDVGDVKTEEQQGHGQGEEEDGVSQRAADGG